MRTLAFLLLIVEVRMQSGQQAVSSLATNYLNQALNVMQQHSLHKKTIPWDELRRQTLDMAAGAQTTADTYDCIRFALTKLGDHHSFLQLNPELQAKEKEAQQQHKKSTQPKAPEEEWPPSPYFDRQTPAGKLDTVANVKVATLVVPALGPSDDGAMHAYAATLQQSITSLVKEHPAGWIVDLRGNMGGNMWPMLAGLSSLEGNGTLGSFLDDEGRSTTWFSGSDGAGFQGIDGKKQILCWMPTQAVHLSEPQIIALLIDRGTASSGEATAISFLGRPRTKSFGRHTHGQSTSNDGFPLSDGANLVLTTAVEADRTGRVYPNGIQPDVELPEEKSKSLGGSTDPMLVAAAAWIAKVSGH